MLSRLPVVLVLIVLFVAACGKKSDQETFEDPPSNLSPPGESDNTPAPTSPISTPALPASAGCGRSISETSYALDLAIGATQRRAYVSLPADYNAQTPYPVVINFHGLSDNAAHQNEIFAMAQEANARGFITVHPEGAAFLGQQSWNAFDFGPTADDIGFFNAILSDLETTLCVQPKNIFLTGLSNGAFMSYRLACVMADKIAGVAAVAGTLGIKNCVPSRPLPVLHLHGTNDKIISFEGSALFPGAQDMADFWINNNRCAATPQTLTTTPFKNQSLKPDWSLAAWTSCADNRNVYLVSVAGGEHIAPWHYDGASIAANATDLILEFFEAYIQR